MWWSTEDTSNDTKHDPNLQTSLDRLPREEEEVLEDTAFLRWARFWAWGETPNSRNLVFNCFTHTFRFKQNIGHVFLSSQVDYSDKKEKLPCQGFFTLPGFLSLRFFGTNEAENVSYNTPSSFLHEIHSWSNQRWQLLKTNILLEITSLITSGDSMMCMCWL